MSADDHGAAGGLMVSFAPGSHIAGYRLEERIGQGGMAVVFRARDERLDRPVALKILAPALADDGEFRRRFISESRAAAAIDDPHIVPVFAAGEADGVLFIATRYVAGGDAHSMLNREGPLPPARVADVISPVASALDAAHRAGLVHRDVKPSNVLMDVLPGRPDHVYLADFGICKAVAPATQVTATGAVLGTLAYMSPEQIGSRPLDGRADQYALACSAFELLTGAPPFRRDEPAAVLYAHLSEPPPPLTARRPDLPQAVDGVLSKALAKAPGDRFASCGQFADALRGALGLQPYRSGPGAAANPVPDPVGAPATEKSTPAALDATMGAGQPTAGTGRVRPRRRRILIAAFIAAAAGLAAGLLLPGTPAPPLTVPISVKSAFPALSGDVYVVYLDGNQASAQVSGEIREAATGEVATLYAQQFPYQRAFTPVSSVILHPAGTTARYAFEVTPTLATRYRVELFPSSTSSAPLGTSGTQTIYVALGETTSQAAPCITAVCHESVQTTFTSPPSALPTEMSKPLYLYFGLNLARTKAAPPTPRWLTLGNGHGLVIALQRLSADRFIETITFSFSVGSDSFTWASNDCVKDSEAADGVGLPGHHGCGDRRILYATNYLG